MRKIAGYRNRMVHFYQEISIQELYEICTKDLIDVETLSLSILKWVRSIRNWLTKGYKPILRIELDRD